MISPPPLASRSSRLWLVWGTAVWEQTRTLLSNNVAALRHVKPTVATDPAIELLIQYNVLQRFIGIKSCLDVPL